MWPFTKKQKLEIALSNNIILKDIWPEPVDHLPKIKNLKILKLNVGRSSPKVAAVLNGDMLLQEWTYTFGRYHLAPIIWPEVDETFEWKKGSITTALITAVEETPLLPVTYKALYYYGVKHGSRYVAPKRIMQTPVCRVDPDHDPPEDRCSCGYHCAYLVSELWKNFKPWNIVGVLVVTPLGRTVWHDNACRSEAYQIHAAVVGKSWEPVPSYGWDTSIPIIRTKNVLIPWMSHEIAREVKAMVDIGIVGTDTRT
ncbi:MAG: hypothetical protein QXJ73_08540 [Candidatus Caldarchaeum sp.]